MTMVSTYPLRPLGEVLENHDSRRIPVKAADRKPGPYPYYGAQGIVDYVDDYIFDGLFVLVAEDGENLRTRNQDIALMASGKFWVNNHAHILRASSGAATRYLKYAINSTDISGYITGSTIPKLSQRGLHSIPIPCPTLAEQEGIVSLLRALDDKIELNRRMNETLEAMAQSIFKDWFVDFGPTRAKVEGRAPYLAPELWDLFPDALDDEDKPVGWEEQPFVSFLDIVGGGTPKTKVAEYWGGGIPWFSVVDTPPKGGVFVRSTEKTISEKGLAESSARLIPAGTTIITARGTVGNIAMAARDMTFNQSCYALRAHAPVGDRFVYLATQRMVQRLQALAHGSVFSTITRATFESLTFPWAGERLFEEFEEVLEPIFTKINANGEENEALASTRNLLLPKLMSGEIRLPEAEKAVEAVA